MGGTPRAPWHAMFLTYPCHTCGAEEGEECTTTNGKWAFPHAARTRAAARCRICGEVTDGPNGPESLCARHRLVRALEIERATTHKRQDPD